MLRENKQTYRQTDGLEFNSMLVKRIAAYTHLSSFFNRLRAIEGYLSEIATFSYPLAFNAPIGVFPLEFQEKVWTAGN